MPSCISLDKCVHALYLHLGLKKKPESVESASEDEDEDEAEKQKVKWCKMLHCMNSASIWYVFVSGTAEFHRMPVE